MSYKPNQTKLVIVLYGRDFYLTYVANNENSEIFGLAVFCVNKNDMLSILIRLYMCMTKDRKEIASFG